MDNIMETKWTLDAISLDKEIQNIKVALVELDSLRVNKKTYIQRGNLFFLTKPDHAVREKEEELEAKQGQRHQVGLQRKKMTKK